MPDLIEYDIAVIGGGAGLMVTEAAISMGYKCAMIEEYKMGGTCLTRGCIPSKIMVGPADMIRETQRARRIGLDFSQPKIDWNEISKRVWEQIDVSKKVEDKLNSIANVTLYKGTAYFIDEHTIAINSNNNSNDIIIKSDKIVIATGARTFIPDIKGLSETGFITSETFFGDKYPKKPWRSLIILGGGAIGVEFAHIFSALGSKVSLVEMQDRILPLEEEEVSHLVKKVFESNGIKVYNNHLATEAEGKEGMKRLKIQSLIEEGPSSEKWIEGEEIFVAAGLKSNGDKLKLEKAGIETDSRGYIITDEYLKTNKDHIWALGDINGFYQFRHKANYEASIVIDNLLGQIEPMKKANYRSVPWAVFTDPQVAHVGMTEKEVAVRYKEYYVGLRKYSQVAGGIALGYKRGDFDEGLVKVLVAPDMSILGAHIAGPNASILLQPFVYLMNAGEKCPSENCRCAEPVNDKASLEGIEESKLKLDEARVICPELGTFKPINDSMVIHPSLNELTAWVFDKLKRVVV